MCLFTLLGSTSVKAVPRTLMKLSPDWGEGEVPVLQISGSFIVCKSSLHLTLLCIQLSSNPKHKDVLITHLRTQT